MNPSGLQFLPPPPGAVSANGEYEATQVPGADYGRTRAVNADGSTVVGCLQEPSTLAVAAVSWRRA
ncbi:MAG: hypothetical protein ACRDXX_05125 [Stackebrandtia sp.]